MIKSYLLLLLSLLFSSVCLAVDRFESSPGHYGQVHRPGTIIRHAVLMTTAGEYSFAAYAVSHYMNQGVAVGAVFVSSLAACNSMTVNETGNWAVGATMARNPVLFFSKSGYACTVAECQSTECDQLVLGTILNERTSCASSDGSRNPSYSSAARIHWSYVPGVSTARVGRDLEPGFLFDVKAVAIALDAPPRHDVRLWTNGTASAESCNTANWSALPASSSADYVSGRYGVAVDGPPLLSGGQRLCAVAETVDSSTFAVVFFVDPVCAVFPTNQPDGSVCAVDAGCMSGSCPTAVQSLPSHCCSDTVSAACVHCNGTGLCDACDGGSGGLAYFLNPGTGDCMLKRDAGAACSSHDQCLSGVCLGDRCCVAGAGDDCASCDATGYCTECQSDVCILVDGYCVAPPLTVADRPTIVFPSNDGWTSMVSVADYGPVIFYSNGTHLLVSSQNLTVTSDSQVQWLTNVVGGGRLTSPVTAAYPSAVQLLSAGGRLGCFYFNHSASLPNDDLMWTVTARSANPRGRFLTRTIAANVYQRGSGTSVAVSRDGYPMVAAWSSFILFARAQTTDGLTLPWTVRLDVDQSGQGAAYPSLAVLTSGVPAISYQRHTGTPGPPWKLLLARAQTIDGTGDWLVSTVDSAEITPRFVGFYTSLAVINRVPMIAYNLYNERQLWVAVATNGNGTGDWIRSPVMSSELNDYGYFPSLRETPTTGRPAISFNVGSGLKMLEPGLVYAENTRADGQGAWSIQQFGDPVPPMLTASSLQFCDGGPGAQEQQPCVSYVDRNAKELKWAIRSSVAPGLWSHAPDATLAPTPVPPQAFSFPVSRGGHFPVQLVAPSGPVIVHLDLSQNQLLVTYWFQNGWRTKLVADDVTPVPSATIVQDTVFCAYVDHSRLNRTITVAHAHVSLLLHEQDPFHFVQPVGNSSDCNLVSMIADSSSSSLVHVIAHCTGRLLHAFCFADAVADDWTVHENVLSSSMLTLPINMIGPAALVFGRPAVMLGLGSAPYIIQYAWQNSGGDGGGASSWSVGPVIMETGSLAGYPSAPVSIVVPRMVMSAWINSTGSVLVAFTSDAAAAHELAWTVTDTGFPGPADLISVSAVYDEETETIMIAAYGPTDRPQKSLWIGEMTIENGDTNNVWRWSIVDRIVRVPGNPPQNLGLSMVVLPTIGGPAIAYNDQTIGSLSWVCRRNGTWQTMPSSDGSWLLGTPFPTPITSTATTSIDIAVTSGTVVSPQPRVTEDDIDLMIMNEQPEPGTNTLLIAGLVLVGVLLVLVGLVSMVLIWRRRQQQQRDDFSTQQSGPGRSRKHTPAVDDISLSTMPAAGGRERRHSHSQSSRRSRRHSQREMVSEPTVGPSNHGHMSPRTRDVVRGLGLPSSQVLPKQSVVVTDTILLGTGAHSRVVEGRYGQLSVAVKQPLVFSSSDNNESTAALIRELKAFERLPRRHPDIVQLYGLVVAGTTGQPQLVFEKCTGGPCHLLVYLQHQQPSMKKVTTLRRRWDIMQGILRAVDVVHSSELVHLDLALRNVLINGDGLPKLSDFGSCRLAGEPMTSFAGDPAWMAPELLLFQSATVLATREMDLFSLGVVLYELFAQQSPWPGLDRTTVTQLVAVEGARLHLDWSSSSSSSSAIATESSSSMLLIQFIEQELMVPVFHAQPDERPHAVSELVKKIQKTAFF